MRQSSVTSDNIKIPFKNDKNDKPGSEGLVIKY